MATRIKFVRDAQYENEGPKKGPKFPTGTVMDATDEFAERWVRRGHAEALDTRAADIGTARYKIVEAGATPAPEGDADPKSADAGKGAKGAAAAK